MTGTERKRPVPKFNVGDQATLLRYVPPISEGARVTVKERQRRYGEYTYRIRYGRTLTTCYESDLAPVIFTEAKNA